MCRQPSPEDLLIEMFGLSRSLDFEIALSVGSISVGYGSEAKIAQERLWRSLQGDRAGLALIAAVES